MRVEVDVKRAEQSWDLDTGVQQNYLVVDVCGVEARVPCTEEQLIAAVTTLRGEEPEQRAEEEQQYRYTAQPVATPRTFVAVDLERERLPPEPAKEPLRRLSPLSRAPSDDVGIAQG